MEAQIEKPGSSSLWIPDAIHRFCVRLELGKAHQPKKLKQFEAELRDCYRSRQRWCYGEILMSCRYLEARLE